MCIRRMVWAVVLLALACGAIPAVGQGTPASAYIAAQTTQGIAFYEVTSEHTLRSAGNLPQRFGLVDKQNLADCRALSQRSFVVSSDRQWIAFTTECGAEARLFLFSLTDGDLTEHAIPSYWLLPDWSPDSEAVLLNPPPLYFEYMPVWNSYVFELASGNWVQVTGHPQIQAHDVQWTPDGQSITYLGWCELGDACEEGLGWTDIYRRSRDGRVRVRIVHLPQFEEIPVISACDFIWSPFDGRLYYKWGDFNCYRGRDRVFSVGVAGDVRFEVDLPTYMRSTDEAYFELPRVDVSNLHPRPEGVYLSASVAYMTLDFRGGFGQWRVLRLNSGGEIETLYVQPMPNLEQGQSPWLDDSVLSPDGQKMVMLFNSGDAQVVDLIDGENLGSIPDENAICRVQWLDDRTLVYESGAPCTDDARRSSSMEMRLFGVETGNVTDLTDSIDGLAWLLSSNDPL